MKFNQYGHRRYGYPSIVMHEKSRKKLISGNRPGCTQTQSFMLHRVRMKIQKSLPSVSMKVHIGLDRRPGNSQVTKSPSRSLHKFQASKGKSHLL